MTDLELIKGVSSISLSKICKEVGVDRSNLLKGKVTQEKISKVKARLVEILDELNLKEKEPVE